MAETNEVRKIAVIGSGIMGSGITQAVLLGGYETVVLSDIDSDALKKSRNTIEAVLKALETEGGFKAYVSNHPFLGHFQDADFAKLKTSRKRVGPMADGTSADELMSRLVCESDLAKAVSDADFVIEAVSERLDLKQELFKKLSEFAPPHAVCASNTSTLPVSAIARFSKRPGNVIGMHFHGFSQAFNRLIEIMGDEKTTEESQALGKQVGESLPSVGGERLVVRLEKEAAGFIANRIAAPLQICHTWLLDKALEQGITFEQLHAAGFDLRINDFIGLDTTVNAVLSFRDHISPDFAPAKAIVALVNEGLLGAKTGQGIYEWDKTGKAVIKETQLEEKTQKFLMENTDPGLGGATRVNAAGRRLEMKVVKGYRAITELERIGEGHEGVIEIGYDRYQEWSKKLEVAAETVGKDYLKPCDMMRSGRFKDYP